MFDPLATSGALLPDQRNLPPSDPTEGLEDPFEGLDLDSAVPTSETPSSWLQAEPPQTSSEQPPTSETPRAPEVPYIPEAPPEHVAEEELPDIEDEFQLDLPPEAPTETAPVTDQIEEIAHDASVDLSEITALFAKHFGTDEDAALLEALTPHFVSIKQMVEKRSSPQEIFAFLTQKIPKTLSNDDRLSIEADLHRLVAALYASYERT